MSERYLDILVKFCSFLSLRRIKKQIIGARETFLGLTRQARGEHAYVELVMCGQSSSGPFPYNIINIRCARSGGAWVGVLSSLKLSRHAARPRSHRSRRACPSARERQSAMFGKHNRGSTNSDVSPTRPALPCTRYQPPGNPSGDS